MLAFPRQPPAAAVPVARASLPLDSACAGDPLLVTKLRLPPPPPDLVARPALLARLDPAPGTRVTLVCAPTGFGKTTALREWAATSARDIAWLSLDRGDDDPARFWSYLLTAVGALRPAVADRALSLARLSELPPLEYIVTALVNALAEDEAPLSLVIDDYHAIRDAAIHRSLRHLLDHLPEQLHVVLSGREDPPLSLARLRALGQLSELRAPDLRFSRDETRAFLGAALDPAPDADAVAALDARAEGWPAGLRLAALALRGQPDPAAVVARFSGSHRAVVDYLVNEVLETLPADEQAFLLTTAPLDRLCGPLCDALTGGDDGQAMLEALERANAFLLPLDDERRWYRYQQLFADALRDRLAKTRPDDLAELHRRAARWLCAHALPADAMAHAAACGDCELIAEIVERHARGMLVTGELNTIRGWLALLPDELIRARAGLCCTQAWVAVLSGRTDLAEPYLDAAERIARERPAGGLPGEVAAIRGYVARLHFRLAEAVALSRRALDLVHPREVTLRRAIALNLGIAHWWDHDADAADAAFDEAIALAEESGNACDTVVAICHRARLWAAYGRLRHADALFGAAERLAAARGVDRYPSQSFVYLGQADLRIEWLRLDDAERLLRACTTLGMAGGRIDHVIIALGELAVLAAERGDHDAARELIEQARAALRRHPAPHLRGAVEADRARVWLATGDEHALGQWIAATDERCAGDTSTLEESEQHALVRALLALDRVEAAARALAPLRERAERTGWPRCRIQTLALDALVGHARGEPGAALSALGCALRLAAPEGYLHVFRELGTPLRELLARLPLGDPAIPAGWRAALTDVPGPTPCQPATPDALSSRELEVLRALSAGLSNREIAASLFVTVGTVKRHTNSIYAKLAVSSRTQAAARARTLGLT